MLTDNDDGRWSVDLSESGNMHVYTGASILGGEGQAPNILLKGPCINRAPPIIKL